jgi:hypothetical protein
MRHFISKTQSIFISKVGRCATCMRQSLAAALAIWAVYGFGLLVWPEWPAQGLFGLLALGLTALWSLHVAVYAVRAVVKARSEDTQMLHPRRAQTTLTRAGLGQIQIERRRALGVLLKAVVVGVVASAPVMLLPSRALAFCGQCTVDNDCGGSVNGWCCKNTAPVNAGYVCNECKEC